MFVRLAPLKKGAVGLVEARAQGLVLPCGLAGEEERLGGEGGGRNEEVGAAEAQQIGRAHV